MHSAEFESNNGWVPSTFFTHSLWLAQFAPSHLRLSPRLRDVGQVLGGIGLGGSKIKYDPCVVSFPILSHFPDPHCLVLDTPTPTLLPLKIHHRYFNARVNECPGPMSTWQTPGRRGKPNVDTASPTWQGPRQPNIDAVNPTTAW